jgi:hypothetical protein
MASTGQAVILAESFTGFGYLPDFTPAHHVERPIGSTLPRPKNWDNRTNPSFGKSPSSGIAASCSNEGQNARSRSNMFNTEALFKVKKSGFLEEAFNSQEYSALTGGQIATSSWELL